MHIYGTFNFFLGKSLQHKFFQLFPRQKNVLYNILKVPKNTLRGKYWNSNIYKLIKTIIVHFLHLLKNILKSLQHKFFQLFPRQKNVLYNILKVPRNTLRGKYWNSNIYKLIKTIIAHFLPFEIKKFKPCFQTRTEGGDPCKLLVLVDSNLCLQIRANDLYDLRSYKTTWH